MKVVAFNGSPRKGGNTEICLNLIGEELNKQGIEQVPPIYDHITLNEDGYYTVKQNGCESRIDKDGNVIE